MNPIEDAHNNTEGDENESDPCRSAGDLGHRDATRYGDNESWTSPVLEHCEDDGQATITHGGPVIVDQRLGDDDAEYDAREDEADTCYSAVHLQAEETNNNANESWTRPTVTHCEADDGSKATRMGLVTVE